MTFTYPIARRSEVVDDYHGVPVADPYRWLEDPSSDETRAFVEAQNELTRAHLDSLPERDALRRRIEELWDVPRVGLPVAHNGVVVWSHNDGLSDQPRFLVRDTDGSERVLLDPNTLSDDGTVAVVLTSLSPDGRYLAYSIAESGSDWQVIKIRKVETGEDLPDEIRFVKFTGVAWDGEAFFYSRFPEQDLSSVEPPRHIAVHRHELGTAQADDPLVFHNADDPDLLYTPVISDDGRTVVLYEFEGTSRRNGLLFRPVGSDGPFERLVDLGVARHDFVDCDETSFLVLTDLDAPNGRLVRIPRSNPSAPLDVVPEGPDVMSAAVATGDAVAVVTLHEASHRVAIHDLDGRTVGTVELPAPGTIDGLSGRRGDPDLYLAFQSFAHPPIALRWNDGRTARFAGSDPGSIDVQVDRIHAPSTDGAQVGMFVVRAPDAALPAPVELYGYGGFNIDLTPTFHPARLAFLEAGGVVVVANLRGGSEHGEGWHTQGMLGRKQQVFDDFIACAETLIDRGVAGPGTIGIRGGSNGGLLTAAVMLQRPDLFGAVVSQVPVADMLRFQHFTAGRFWTVEYGDADRDRDAFEWLYAYSPYHNPRAGLPPLLITTAESDDRVVPMHALKLAAALQHAAGGTSETPLLVRAETRAGHGLGKPTGKLIDEAADIFGFLLHHTTG